MDWSREQKQHDLEMVQKNTQEELERKRDEDEFQDKKLSWEKDLTQRKEELEAQRKELEELRKQKIQDLIKR